MINERPKITTSSFFKSFVATDEKAIEQFLCDLENTKLLKPINLEPTQDEIEQKEKMLAILKAKMPLNIN